MSRVKSTIKNMNYAIIGQVAGLIIQFISRIVFVRILSSEYLGLNGLFTNILTMLSFAELGFGTAITYSLYGPLANKEIEKIKSLMWLFKKVYIVVGSIVMLAGIVLTPFLSFFINEIPEISNIKLIYLLFVINTAISYFYSYKRTLIIADQNRYIATIYRYVCYFIMNLIQIIILLVTKNYILYLVIQVMFTLIENILVSIKADKMYPYLKDNNIKQLDKETKNEIIKNTKAMMMHKIGSIVVNSTDNIIISKFVGLVSVGIYSNYFTVKQALNLITSQLYNSLSASIGNLCVEDDIERQYKTFKKINFITFWIFSFSSICCMVLFTPFIKIWVGSDYLFNELTTLAIVIVYYLTGMRKSVLTFRESMGLFYKDRWKSIIEAFVNLIVSIILARKFGVLGVFLGTIISSITVCIWIEVFVLFKYGFNMSTRYYFRDYFKYSLFSIIVGVLTYYICYIINPSILVMEFIIKGLVCLIVPNILLILVFYKTEEFQYFWNLALKFTNRRLKVA